MRGHTTHTVDINSIESKALELAELKRRAADALSAGDLEEHLDLLVEQSVAIAGLQQALMEQSVVIVRAPAAQRVLSDLDLSENENVTEKGEELLYSRFSTRDYVTRLSLVNALISPVEVPASLRSFVEEARQCYGFAQYNAVYSLSRTILETAVNDICVRIGRMPRRVVEEDCFMEYPFRRRVGLLLAGRRSEQIIEHYRLLCRLIHGGTTVHGGEALTALGETLAFASFLYQVDRQFIKLPPT